MFSFFTRLFRREPEPVTATELTKGASIIAKGLLDASRKFPLQLRTFDLHIISNKDEFLVYEMVGFFAALVDFAALGHPNAKKWRSAVLNELATINTGQIRAGRISIPNGSASVSVPYGSTLIHDRVALYRKHVETTNDVKSLVTLFNHVVALVDVQRSGQPPLRLSAHFDQQTLLAELLNSKHIINCGRWPDSFRDNAVFGITAEHIDGFLPIITDFFDLCDKEVAPLA